MISGKIIKKILILFFVWRMTLFVIAFLSTILISKFGARFPYSNELLASTKLPDWIWGFGNFDGVHYLTIANSGYMAQYTQVFFPLYPMFLGMLNFIGSFQAGLMVSNLLFLVSLFLYFKLLIVDYSQNTAFKSILLILLLPTSFYFGSVYSESLFLSLALLCLIFIRKKNFLIAGVFAGLASATRIFGLGLLMVLIIEFFLIMKCQKIALNSSKFLSGVLGILMAPLGFVVYAVYLQVKFGDWLFFLNAQPVFGAERSNQPFILLPQVFFRYIKILLTVPIDSLIYFNAALEFSVAILFLILIIFSFKKVRLSYWIFSSVCFILPTLTGTFSSMPRYALMGFLLLPLVARIKKIEILYPVLLCMQAVLLALFIRGYWVA